MLWVGQVVCPALQPEAGTKARTTSYRGERRFFQVFRRRSRSSIMIFIQTPLIGIELLMSNKQKVLIKSIPALSTQMIESSEY